MGAISPRRLSVLAAVVVGGGVLRVATRATTADPSTVTLPKVREVWESPPHPSPVHHHASQGVQGSEAEGQAAQPSPLA